MKLVITRAMSKNNSNRTDPVRFRDKCRQITGEKNSCRKIKKVVRQVNKRRVAWSVSRSYHDKECNDSAEEQQG